MKASELRIGNYIGILDPGIETECTAEHIKFIADGDATYRPIPLTEKWLKRIDWRGYEYLYFNSHFCLDDSGHLYYRGDYTGINVNYVHQLQNLYFALTHEELTIKP